MASPQPVFSVVVPTYNCAALLADALQSVAAQDCRDYEVVVSDGASTDGTLAVVERFRSLFPAATVSSRRDSGIYDAINQGIASARGRWIYVLGSDDRLHRSDVLSKMAQVLGTARERFVYGDVRVIGVNTLAQDGGRYGGVFDFRRMLRQNICQQAVFYRRDLFDVFGLFDTRYRLLADWHLAMRVIVEEPTRWVDMIVCDYATSGMSAASADTAFMADFRSNVKRLVVAHPLRLDLWWACARHAWQGQVERRKGLRGSSKAA